ncbi:MAG: carboxypeptidase-like regulatory domain-containing protein [Bacteroidota bacterium]
MKAPIFLLFVLSFFSTIITAQDQYTLTGIVLDKNTKEPLPYAHIGIPELGIGTTSSERGEFKIKLPSDNLEVELMISFIGYEAYKKKVSQLGNPANIEIKATVTNLMEIEVLDQVAVESIIRKAVNNIPKNYPTYPHTDLAFYRESRTGKDSQYLYMAEGVLNVYKKSYRSTKEGQVSLVQGRKINLRDPLDTLVRSGFTSGHMAAHRFDFVYNREDFLQEKYFPVYNYWIESMTSYNGNPVYVIAFAKDYEVTKAYYDTEKKKRRFGWNLLKRNTKSQKKRLTARMKGRLYIDKNSYAIIKGEFEITPKGLKKINDYPLYSGNWKGNAYEVNYQKLGDKWFFSDAFRKGLYGGGGLYMNEVKITQINPKKSGPLPYLDRISKGQRFTKMTGTYDPNFWNNYNTTPLNTDLAASVEQLQNAKTANEALDPLYLAELQLRRDSIEFEKRKLEIAKEREQLELEDLDMSEIELTQMQRKIIERQIKRKQKKKKRKNFNRFSASFGLGTHLIATEANDMSITILTDDEPRENILTVNEETQRRDFEIIGQYDFDLFWTKNIFTRFGGSFDFYNSKYKERAIGMGLQMNLSRQRPFFFRAIAQYSNLKYYRKLGDGDNDFGKFRINGTRFKANTIRVNYGSRTHNLKLSGEFALELNPSRELYVRGTYFMPFARRQDIWLKERKELFRKDTRVEVDNSRVQVTQNDIPFDGRIMPEETISITVGYLFK